MPNISTASSELLAWIGDLLLAASATNAPLGPIISRMERSGGVEVSGEIGALVVAPSTDLREMLHSVRHGDPPFGR